MSGVAPDSSAGQQHSAMATQSSIPGNLPPAEQARRAFIDDLTRRVEASYDETKQEARALRRRESTVFAASIASGVVAVGLIVAGFVLIALSQLGLAVVSETVALVSGGGTIAFRQSAKDIARRREALSAKESEETMILRAVGVSLLIPDDDERNRALVELAGRLAGAVGRTAQKT